MKVSILHYGAENHYLFGLVSGLLKFDELELDIIGSNNSEALFAKQIKVIHYNLRRSIDPSRKNIEKIINLFFFYLRLIIYCSKSDSQIFHIQWQTNFYLIDRFILLPLLRLRNKKVVYTAHNVDDQGRDEKESILNKLTLKFFYSQFNAIIVHTEKVRDEIEHRFRINKEKIYVIPHGINIKVNKTAIGTKEARKSFNIDDEKKVLLCFGAVEPYKGIDLLLQSLKLLLEKDESYYLIIAGRSLNKNYLEKLELITKENNLQGNTKFVNQFIPDDQIEYYFNAADCLILPYKNIYQSGVLFLSYSFGLPVIATNVGNFDQDILVGKTGLLVEKNNIYDLADKISSFYNTNLFTEKDSTREFIIKYAQEKYSWEKIGYSTYILYQSLFIN